MTLYRCTRHDAEFMESGSSRRQKLRRADLSMATAESRGDATFWSNSQVCVSSCPATGGTIDGLRSRENGLFAMALHFYPCCSRFIFLPAAKGSPMTATLKIFKEDRAAHHVQLLVWLFMRNFFLWLGRSLKRRMAAWTPNEVFFQKNFSSFLRCSRLAECRWNF